MHGYENKPFVEIVQEQSSQKLRFYQIKKKSVKMSNLWNGLLYEMILCIYWHIYFIVFTYSFVKDNPTFRSFVPFSGVLPEAKGANVHYWPRTKNPRAIQL